MSRVVNLASSEKTCTTSTPLWPITLVVIRECACTTCFLRNGPSPQNSLTSNAMLVRSLPIKDTSSRNHMARILANHPPISLIRLNQAFQKVGSLDKNLALTQPPTPHGRHNLVQVLVPLLNQIPPLLLRQDVIIAFLFFGQVLAMSLLRRSGRCPLLLVVRVVIAAGVVGHGRHFPRLAIPHGFFGRDVAIPCLALFPLLRWAVRGFIFGCCFIGSFVVVVAATALPQFVCSRSRIRPLDACDGS
ncbi:hypothetical protein CUC08_Gglean003596 [Alternaria sp. MG1]|nr:hypothetical protein CUC08_Gglean003596 [Alternaria sp. MG1]